MVVLGRRSSPIRIDDKTKANDTKSITPCIRCNVCYISSGSASPSKLPEPVPESRAEQDLPIPARKKKVMIVGAGPAGIRCAPPHPNAAMMSPFTTNNPMWAAWCIPAPGHSAGAMSRVRGNGSTCAAQRYGEAELNRVTPRW